MGVIVSRVTVVLCHGVDIRCCKGKDVSQFASSQMRGLNYDMVGSDSISAAMFDEIQSYVHDSIWNNAVRGSIASTSHPGPLPTSRGPSMRASLLLRSRS